MNLYYNPWNTIVLNMSPIRFQAALCLLAVAAFGQTVEEITELIPVESPAVYFSPPNLMNIKEGVFTTVNWYTTLPEANGVIYHTQDETVSKMVNWTETIEMDDSGNFTAYGSFVVEALFLGHNSFNVTIVDVNNITLNSSAINATVLLPYQLFNVVFTYLMLFLTFVAYINMGATLDLQVVMKTLKRPIGPIVGVICQYTIMPLASYGLAHIFFPNDPLSMLGMFLIGSSPGGGLSNIWTFLFKGSLDLSVTMTLTSTLFAFAAVPFWVFLLGPTIFADTEFKIPFVNIVGLIIMLIVPCGLGIVIQIYKPKIGAFIKQYVLKIVALFNAIFVMTVGFYAYRYVFQMFTVMSLLASFLLPVCGYFCGFIIATLVRRPLDEKIAISIETGVQNAQIPILILKLSLGSPTGDLAIVVPAAIVVLTPLTLLIVYIIKNSINKYCKGKQVDISTDKKQAVTNGKTNESFDQHPSDKGSLPVVSVDNMNGFHNHTNPGFVADGTYSHGYPVSQDLENGVKARESTTNGDVYVIQPRNSTNGLIHTRADNSNDTHDNDIFNGVQHPSHLERD